MKNHVFTKSDAAAIAYFESCLRGKAFRIRKKWDAIVQHELLILNEPYQENEHEEKIDQTPMRDDLIEEQIINKMALEKAMRKLTIKENAIIYELFWNGKNVKELCSEKLVSKNSILKIKRNALRKLKNELGE